MRRFPALLAAASLSAAAAVLPLPPASAADGPAWSVGPTADASGATRANFDYSLDPGAVVEDSIVAGTVGHGAVVVRTVVGVDAKISDGEHLRDARVPEPVD